MAHFRTAYQQKEILLDLAVKGTAVDAEDIVVGSLVKLTAATAATETTAATPAYIELVTSLADATHIVAQSDTTQEYGHIPVEYQNYKPTFSVKATFKDAVAEDSPTKKVALFLLSDKTDIILSGSETA